MLVNVDSLLTEECGALAVTINKYAIPRLGVGLSLLVARSSGTGGNW